MTDKKKRHTSPSSNYEIGYRKTPVTTRFKPGRSGNPLGRPKRSSENPNGLNDERLKAIVLEEAYRLVPINDPNGRIDIPIAQAVVRSLAVNAATGNQRAQRLFTELLASVERDNRQQSDQRLLTDVEYKISWEK